MKTKIVGLVAVMIGFPVIACASEIKIKCKYESHRSGLIPEEAIYVINEKEKNVVAYDAIIHFAQQRPKTTRYTYFKSKPSFHFNWKVKLPVELTRRTHTFEAKRKIGYYATFYPGTMTVDLTARVPGNYRVSVTSERCKPTK